MKQAKLPVKLFMWDFISCAWEDAFIMRGGARASDVLDAFKPCIRHTSGYVLAYDDLHLVIAATDDRESNTDQDCEDINVIPRGMIRKITKPHAR